MERPLANIIRRLRDVYGTPRAEITDPFEMILLENVAYLVDDATCVVRGECRFYSNLMARSRV